MILSSASGAKRLGWRIAGAQAVLSLPAIYVNHDWGTFHADRIQVEQRKLYPYKRRLRAILNCAT